MLRALDTLNLEPRALGRTNYPAEFPLREVYVIAKHCSGGVILGAGAGARASASAITVKLDPQTKETAACSSI